MKNKKGKGKIKTKHDENPMMRMFLKMDKNGNIKKNRKNKGC